MGAVRVHPGRPAAHPTAVGWGEELWARTAGVRLPIHMSIHVHALISVIARAWAVCVGCVSFGSLVMLRHWYRLATEWLADLYRCWMVERLKDLI